MSTQLNRSGHVVDLGSGVGVSTPGLDGEAGLVDADRDSGWGDASGRGLDPAWAAAFQGLRQADLQQQLSVRLDLAVPESQTRRRSRELSAPVTLDLPAPPAGQGQVLLHRADDGLVSWHFPQPGERGGRHPLSQNTYRLDRKLLLGGPAGAAQGPAVTRDDADVRGDDPDDRGLAALVARNLLTAFVFPLIDPILGRISNGFAKRWEVRNRPEGLRRITGQGIPGRGSATMSAAECADLATGPVLLLVHGTFSTARSAYSALPVATRAELIRRYRGRVIAFDHPSVSARLSENVAGLRRLLDEAAVTGPLTVDVVSHSRGGLVGRALAERAAQYGLAGRLTVRNLVMVAAPNAGTVLADPRRLTGLVDRVTNLAMLLPGTGIADVVSVIAVVVKQLSVGAFGGLEGIAAMDPQGDPLKQFNNSPGSSASYSVICSDFEPADGSPLARLTRDRATDRLFGETANDLVVPTLGSYEVPGSMCFPVSERVVIPSTAGVDHSSYFASPVVSQALLRWLPG